MACTWVAGGNAKANRSRPFQPARNGNEDRCKPFVASVMESMQDVEWR